MPLIHRVENDFVRLLGLSGLAMLCACAGKPIEIRSGLPLICNSGPPEAGGQSYRAWKQAYEEAGCEAKIKATGVSH